MRSRLRRRWVVHTFWAATHFIGIRARLRCPHCQAIGTWKPHGGIMFRRQARSVRRWLCKWCGAYEGPDEKGNRWVITTAFPNRERGCWTLMHNHDSTVRAGEFRPTPRSTIILNLPTTSGKGVNPWTG